MSRLHILSLATLAAATACGSLENPDLTVGAVAGRVANTAASGGYVYVLGAPDRMANLASDGTYAIGGVPIGDRQLVVVAAAGGVVKAELAPVTVNPGMTSAVPDRDAATMAQAGRILASALPAGYSRSNSARFTLEQTIYRDVTGGAAVLADIPAGTWTLTTRLRGFKSRQHSVQVQVATDTDSPEPLDVDDADAEKGCISATCVGSLVCDPADGNCYGCLGDSDCAAGEHCDMASRTCTADGTGAGLCESATAASQCATGVLVTPASGPSYCSRACPGQSDCPAGWTCAGSPGQCQVVQSCVATAAAFGSSCASSSTCQASLAGGRCLRSDEDKPGYCSAACTTDQQCIDAGFGTCKPWGTSGSYCQP